MRNQAETYANEVVPIARGDAQRTIQDAEGYKNKVIAEAEGDASRFSQLLVEYKKDTGSYQTKALPRCCSVCNGQ